MTDIYLSDKVKLIGADGRERTVLVFAPIVPKGDPKTLLQNATPLSKK